MTRISCLIALALGAVLSVPSWAAEFRVSEGATITADLRHRGVLQIKVTGDDPVTLDLPNGQRILLTRVADSSQTSGYRLRLEMPLVKPKPAADSNVGPVQLETHDDMVTLTFASR